MDTHRSATNTVQILETTQGVSTSSESYIQQRTEHRPACSRKCYLVCESRKQFSGTLGIVRP